MLIRHQRRAGSILPLVAVCLIALVAMIALGIDLGVLAVARTEAQNAADLAALAGVRTLKGAVTDNNRTAAEAFAKTAANGNTVLNQAVQAAQVTVTTGVYVYDPVTQQFAADFSGTQGTNWTAMRVQIATSQPTYFAQLFGLGPVNVGAVATAVHRPRDVAIVLDFSTSMQYSSNTNIRGTTAGAATAGSQNPDPIYPQFGPWAIFPSTGANPMMAVSNYADRGGEGHGLSNLTLANNNGPPIIGDFLYDTGGGTTFSNAFVGPSVDPGSFACTSAARYSPTNTPVVTPAPSAWATQPSLTQGGDLWPLKKPKTYQTTPNPALADYASTVKELLTGTNGAFANSTNGTPANVNSWDGSGYDFDPNTTEIKPGYVPGVYATSTFKGYAMGPGYYGKSFYMWPPDPRTPASSPGQPTYVPGDWRQRYFNTQDNSVLWDNSGNWKGAGATVQYSQILAWIKSGPQTLPGNLQSGRIVYYSSIPSDVNVSGTSATDLDKIFWKNYIDFVLGYGSYPQNVSLYGQSGSNGFGGSTFGATVKITPRSLLTGSPKPYMNYNDLPIHPRAHFWFGPLSMLAFMTGVKEYGRNWLPGTSHEAHCWHLKAGIQSAISDIQNNHPNDFASLIYFSTLLNYNTTRVTLGQKYKELVNTLWYPYDNVDHALGTGAVSGTMRPYDTNWSDLSYGQIPNSNGGTNPTGGFMTAYNEFVTNGRRGATKVVVYETDGVAHDYYDVGSSYNSGTGTFGLSAPGDYQGYVDEAVSYDVTNRSKTEQVKMACVLCNPTTGASSRTFATPDFSVNVPAIPGLSTARAPVRIHSIGFGELFEPNLTPQLTQGTPSFVDSLMQACAMKCLLYVQMAGGTSPPTDTVGTCWGFPGTPTTPGSPGPPVVRGGGGYTTGSQSFKVIVGDYSTRIDILREALQRIMQSGVQLALVE